MRLDRFYGPRQEIMFLSKLCLVDVLMDLTGLDRFFIQSVILFGLSLVFNLNVSHLDSISFCPLAYRV